MIYQLQLAKTCPKILRYILCWLWQWGVSFVQKVARSPAVDWKSINFPFSVFCPISPIRFCSTSVGCNRCYDLIKETRPIRKEKHNLSKPDDKNVKIISVVQHSTKKDLSKGWILWNLFKIILWGYYIACSLKVGLTFVRLAQILKPIDQIILAAKIFWKFWLGASICTLNEPCNINNILSTQNIAGFIITTRKVQIQIILVVGWKRRKPGSQPRCSSCWGRCTFAPLRGEGGCRCRSQG